MKKIIRRKRKQNKTKKERSLDLRVFKKAMTVLLFIGILSNPISTVIYGATSSELDLESEEKGQYSFNVDNSTNTNNNNDKGKVYYVSGEGERLIYTTGLESLISEISKNLGLSEDYIRAIAIRLNASYLYRDADIYTEKTENKLLNTTKVEICPFVTNVNAQLRGSEYYLPDCLWTLSKHLKETIEKRSKNRKDLESIYTADRDRIIFYEAYESLYDYDVDITKIAQLYTDLLNTKKKDECVVDISEEGNYTINEKFIPIFKKYGIENTEILAQALSLDEKLLQSASEYAIKDAPLKKTTYVYGETSRYNMMKAGIGLVGKVRYVWGGGHGIHSIHGYSPIWFVFNEQYKDNEASNISPSGNTWCPIHGSTGNCAYRGEVVRTATDYRKARKDIFGNSVYWKGVMNMSDVCDNEVLVKNGISIHQLEGLDCSGFCSWLYNQIDTSRIYDSSASGFVSNGGLEPVSLTDLQTGDIANWSSHVICIVGKYAPNVYIAVESTSYTVKLGVYYITGANTKDIQNAKALAKKYNKLIGNIDESICVNTLNLDSLGAGGGRLAKPYKDNDTKIKDNKTITELNAEEILELVTESLPDEYIWGKSKN